MEYIVGSLTNLRFSYWNITMCRICFQFSNIFRKVLKKLNVDILTKIPCQKRISKVELKNRKGIEKQLFQDFMFNKHDF